MPTRNQHNYIHKKKEHSTVHVHNCCNYVAINKCLIIIFLGDEQNHLEASEHSVQLISQIGCQGFLTLHSLDNK